MLLQLEAKEEDKILLRFITEPITKKWLWKSIAF
jgi:hypothetical protein